jgi:hypothetical protein
VRLAVWIGGIGLVLLALAASGQGALSSPPLGDPGRWQAWFEQREPAEAAFAILRLAAVGGCWYLATTTVVGALLRLFRADVLVAVVDRVTVAPVRHLLAGSLTLTLVGLGPTGVLAAAAQPVPTTTSTSTSTSTNVAPTTTTTTPATITMRRLPSPGPEPSPPAPPTPTEIQVADSYTVVPGDCFWTIADDLLDHAWGRAPSDAEIVPYWLRLIEANRAELADPGNADLIYPGQVFAVPTLPPPGA